MKISSKRKLTPEEEAILRVVAESRGWDYVEKNEALILDSARSIGELPQTEDDAAGYDPGQRSAGLVRDESADEAILRRMNEWPNCPRRVCDGGQDEAAASSFYIVKARHGGQGEASTPP
jgi:hypothetical protein